MFTPPMANGAVEQPEEYNTAEETLESDPDILGGGGNSTNLLIPCIVPYEQLRPGEEQLLTKKKP